ncbi:CGNR zinc finger domain-containing protein [Aeromicrobium sp. UC242_57]|uniref:CGNR zinc finger domain-containing protein n=1 Tax=Aeromicrobium sp. UC242_57 TaxID=3374624 RepID=UPI0037BE1E2D
MTRDETELAQVRAIRPQLRELLTADRDEAVEIVNGILRDAQALPRLVRHESTDWHLHAVEDDRPLAVRIAVETAMAMIDVIRADELSRLDVCADPDCDGLVLDLSRNRSKRFCSSTCGNRAAVAAYRARRSG